MKDHTKFELAKELNKISKVPLVTAIPANEMFMTEFMAYAHKVNVKTLSSSGDSTRIEIIFDVYLASSIKN